MYLLCVFRPWTPHREIKLLCMTIMCTWNSSLASVLKKGENRCHRKISAQFCFCSRWVGVLKYLFWLRSGSVRVFKQTSPVIDEQGLQHSGPGCMVKLGAWVPLEWRRRFQAWASLCICIALSVTLCYLQNKAAEPDPSWDSGLQGRGWKCSALGERGFRSCVHVESLPKAVPKAHCGWQGNASISAWTAEGCLVGSLLCWTWTLNHFEFIKHLGICRFSNPK